MYLMWQLVGNYIVIVPLSLPILQVAAIYRDANILSLKFYNCQSILSQSTSDAVGI
jgi:hypothetical protein